MNEQIKELIKETSLAVQEGYKNELYKSVDTAALPSKENVLEILSLLKRVMFPGFFKSKGTADELPEYFVGNILTDVYKLLKREIRKAVSYTDKDCASSDTCPDQKAEELCTSFFKSIPKIQDLLVKDVEAEFTGDPAANSREEIIFSYPGIYAIFSYRIAHELYILNVPFIPRMISENAHSITGVDINPGATIGEYFFIDHGTGIVIGETTVIGDNVKIYQGVTLGAISTRGGRALNSVKRHPTIENNVTIYANATILGGDTVIGEGCVIGGNSFVMESVAPGTKVVLKTLPHDFK